jgi:hypothetical protein
MPPDGQVSKGRLACLLMGADVAVFVNGLAVFISAQIGLQI